MFNPQGCSRRFPIQVVPGLLATWISISAFAQAPQHRWIQDSWLDVYATPAKEGQVVGHWVANTEVVVTKQENDWCYASTVASTLFPPDSAHAGYVSCRALGERKLTIKDTQDAMTAFWLEPSIQRFASAGQDLNYRALTENQRELENAERKPIRFTIPQFEAMKQRLTQGIIPDISWQSRRREVKGFHDLRGDELVNGDELFDYVKSLQPSKYLPSISPSLFKQQSDVLLNLEANADAVAALLKRANKVSFSGKAEWVAGHQDEGVASIWDIGKVDIQYAAPVTLHAVSRFGLVGARRLESTTYSPYSPDEGCQDGYQELPNGVDLPDYPRIKEHPLIAFVLAKPLHIKKVDVLTYKARILASEAPYSGPKKFEERLTFVHTIDLNSDGIPEFATIEMNSPGSIEDGYTIARYFHFINISGAWWFAGVDDYTECT